MPQLLLILLLCFTACGGVKKTENNTKNLRAATPVRTQPLKRQSIAQPIVVSGVVASQTEVKLAFKTGGIIDQIYAKEGQTVVRGQLLAKLNMSEIEAQVAQANIGLKKADRDLERAKNLYADSVATLEQLQNATTGQEISASALKIAAFNQKYSTIYAPVTGRVVRQFAEAGELIGASNPVLLIASTEQAFVIKVGLTDREVVRTKLGDPATVKIDAHPQKKFKAFVTQIAQTASPLTGTYEVELQIDNAQNLVLIAGFVAQAEIQPHDIQNYVVISPASLVEADGEKGYVYVLKGTEVQKTLVKILLITSKYIAIDADIPLDTKIVHEGVGYLMDKTQVTELK